MWSGELTPTGQAIVNCGCQLTESSTCCIRFLLLHNQLPQTHEIMVFTIFEHSCDAKAPELDLDFLPNFVFF